MGRVKVPSIPVAPLVARHARRSAMIPAEVPLVTPDETVPEAREREIGDFLVRFGLEQDDLGALLEGVTARLRQAGFALRRMLIGSDYLHPVIGGISYRWRPETGVEESVWERTFDIDSSDSWLRSPLFALVESKIGLPLSCCVGIG